MKRAGLFGILSLLWSGITVLGACTYTIAPGSVSVAASGGAGNASMTAGSSCAWTASATNSWIHPGGAATGNGSVTYTVDPNLGYTSRSGNIVAGNKTLLITQAGLPVPVGVGVNNTNLIWTTSPTYPWYTTNVPAPAFDGVNSAVSGNRYVQDSVSWMQTSVVGPGKLTFWWKVDSDVFPPPPDPAESFDDLEFLIDGGMQDQIMGQVDWNYRSYDIAEGVHTLQWKYTKDPQYNMGSDQAWVDRVTYTTNTPMALQAGLNTCGVTWTSGGNTNLTEWNSQSCVSHDGKLAAQSGSIFIGQQSWMQTTVSGVTNLSFWWKVSSQTNYDFCEFYTNNVLARRISGEVDWQSNFFKLPSTTNVLKWRYAKTNFNFVAQGSDCSWVDQVTLTPAPKGFPFTLLAPATLPDGRAQITVQGEAGCPCQLQASTNLVSWTVLTNVNVTNGQLTVMDSAAANSNVKFYRSLSP